MTVRPNGSGDIARSWFKDNTVAIRAQVVSAGTTGVSSAAKGMQGGVLRGRSDLFLGRRWTNDLRSHVGEY